MSIRGGFHGRLHRGIREVLFCTHPLFRGIRNDPCFFFYGHSFRFSGNGDVRFKVTG